MAVACAALLLLAGGCSKGPAVPAEGCLDCHAGMSGFAAGHDPAVIGCAVCHLGDARAGKAELAHRGMVRIPGNLSSAGATCGTTGCHPGIAERVEASLMNTMAGVVAVDRWVFDEQPTPDGRVPVQDLGHSPADSHLRGLCASCHLGAEKEKAAPVSELTRGGGCNACHLQYDKAALAAWTLPGEKGPAVHPRLSVLVTDDHCFGCHSRSGRIATSYEGWHETLLSAEEGRHQKDHRVLEDGRVFRRVSEDVHHALGLACVDCHDHLEVMGDGHTHLHKEDAVRVRCGDCHFHADPETRVLAELNPDEQRMLRLLGRADPQAQYVVGPVSGRSLLNVTRQPGGTARLTARHSGTQHTLSSPDPACERGRVHADLTCGSCHSAWAPSCISCHTRYDPQGAGYDLLENRERVGRWEEEPGGFHADLPALGVSEEEPGLRRIGTFVPGMVLDLDAGRFPGAPAARRFRRLYAPAEPHTTTRKSRVCTDCHNAPSALGYGRGRLQQVAPAPAEAWTFDPDYPVREEDGLPQDAWIGLMEESPGRRSTRSTTRPFNREEQRRILRAGTCLRCHKGDGPVMLEALDDPRAVLGRRKPACLTPPETAP